MCELGRHVELGEKKHYLTIVGESDTLTPKPRVEPKREDEYTIPELQQKFGTSLEHIGFGVFRDPEGNIWDYRLGEDGNSCTLRGKYNFYFG